jgi:hypothetical protein
VVLQRLYLRNLTEEKSGEKGKREVVNNRWKETSKRQQEKEKEGNNKQKHK